VSLIFSAARLPKDAADGQFHTVYKEAVTIAFTRKVWNMTINSKYVCCTKLILLAFLIYT